MICVLNFLFIVHKKIKCVKNDLEIVLARALTTHTCSFITLYFICCFDKQYSMCVYFGFIWRIQSFSVASDYRLSHEEFELLMLRLFVKFNAHSSKQSNFIYLKLRIYAMNGEREKKFHKVLRYDKIGCNFEIYFAIWMVWNSAYIWQLVLSFVLR